MEQFGIEISVWGLIGLYLGLQTLYVVLNTLKSIWQIKAGKLLASLSSAICYFVYVFVLIFTTTNFGTGFWGDTIIKAILTFVTNFVGVWVSMRLLERLRKDKLWKIEATIKSEYKEQLNTILYHNVGFNYIPTFDQTEYVYNIYSKNKEESEFIKECLAKVNAKYTVYEETVRL